MKPYPYADLFPARPSRDTIARHAGGRRDLITAGQLAIRATTTDAGLLTTLTGRAVPYRAPQVIITDLFSEEILPGAFRDSLAATPTLPLLWAHDAKAAPIGVATSWDDHPDALWGTWRLDSSPVAQEVGRLIAEGIVAGLSIGFQYEPGDARWTMLNGLDHVQIRRARLVEVSVVSTPAYPGATITGIRAHRLTGY